MIYKRTAARWLPLAALGSVVASAACKKESTVVQLPNDPAPQRAAQSFVHCVEARTSQCVEAADQLAGWDSFYLLAWMGGGSPLAILEALPAELAAHTSSRQVQRRFVGEVERYASSIRGAECQGTSTQPIEPLIDQVASVAKERLGRMGLWTGNIDRVVDSLVQEAHEGLDGGSLVRLECRRDPFQLYVATREQDGRHSVVGLTTLLPEFIAGDSPGRQMVTQRLSSRTLGLSSTAAPVTEGVVDAWMAFPVEEF